MPKQIVFLVHGMGSHAQGWSQPVQAQLRELYQGFDGLAQMPFEQRFELTEVRYDDIFEDIRKQWQKDMAAVLAVMGKQGLDSDAVDLLTKAGKTPAADNFLWTHVLDVLFYRFVPTVREAVRTRVALQILDAIRKTPDTGAIRWSVLAHSLGTAVTHDAIDALYRTPIPGEQHPLSPNDTRANLVMMVANVSRVLQTDANVYEGFVRPALTPDPGRACGWLLTTRHKWDPFPAPKRFDPDKSWPDPATRGAGRFQSIVVEHILEKDIHGFGHYLMNPEVHVPMFRAMTAPYMITDEENQARVEAFRARSAASPMAAKIGKKLEELLPADNAGWREFIDALIRYGQVLV